jgi:hypothetical protein
LAEVGAGKANWSIGQPPHGRPAMDSHESDMSKSATPPRDLGRVPAKFPHKPTQFATGWLPFEPIQPLSWPNTSPPVVEPRTLVNFDL